MSMEQVTYSETKNPTPPELGAPRYEYLQVQAVVTNFTSVPMVIMGSDLSWGKWMQSPVNVNPFSSMRFGSQGRDSSPTGTTGWAKWQVGNAVITVNFDCPLHGKNSQSIDCAPAGLFKVTATGTGGDINFVTFEIKPA